MALRAISLGHLVRTNFAHTSTRESIVITAAAVPVIVACVEKVLDLIAADHRIATLDGVVTASFPSLKRATRQ